jgi:protein-S-isoprenylcysteine O-methyltransferase Ste14
MYLGMLLLLLGWLIILGNPVNFIPLIGFIIGMNQLQIKPEEAILKQKFGAEYEAYSQRVRRWI